MNHKFLNYWKTYVQSGRLVWSMAAFFDQIFETKTESDRERTRFYVIILEVKIIFEISYLKIYYGTWKCDTYPFIEPKINASVIIDHDINFGI